MNHEVLTADEVRKIHETSMRVLETVGVEMPVEEAQQVFRSHGIRVENARVYPTEAQVMAALADVPKRFVLHARNPERSVEIGEGSAVTAPGYGAPFLVDRETGKALPDPRGLRQPHEDRPRAPQPGRERSPHRGARGRRAGAPAHAARAPGPLGQAVHGEHGRGGGCDTDAGDGAHRLRRGSRRPCGHRLARQQPQPARLRQRHARRAARVRQGAPARDHRRARHGRHDGAGLAGRHAGHADRGTACRARAHPAHQPRHARRCSARPLRTSTCAWAR